MKRGHPLERRTLLKRTSRLARTTAIRKRNPRKGSRFPKRRDPAYCAWIRTLPCLCSPPDVVGMDGEASCAGRVECAHVVSRGAGGDDRGNTVPLCTRHHRRQHMAGIRSFQAWYSLDLAAIATELASRSPASPASASPERDE